MEIIEQVKNLINTPTLKEPKPLTARAFDSGFSKAHDTYNAISAASDGRIYYVLSSELIDTGGKMYCFDPADESIELLGDLTEICGEKDAHSVPQGKSHVRFFESNGKLYFSTHVGYYELVDGMDRLPQNPPGGYKRYPGGHILSFDLTTRKFEDLALIPRGEGVVSMTMDCARQQIFAITWPTGHFIHYDVKTSKLNDLGPTAGRGEAGEPGVDFHSLCRSLFVHPDTGTVYFSTADGNIFYYNPGEGEIRILEDVDLRIDYFGKYDSKRPGSMGYNWRKIFWYDAEKAAYAVHGNSGYLFRLDPAKPEIELIQRISSKLSQKCGMFDQFSYGYLGFQLGPEETIYFLTGGPIYVNGRRLKGRDEIAKGAAKGLENLHLVTYNITKGEYQDHGPIFYENGDRPLYVNSIAIGADENIYSLARITRNNTTVTDLICIPNPFK